MVSGKDLIVDSDEFIELKQGERKKVVARKKFYGTSPSIAFTAWYRYNDVEEWRPRKCIMIELGAFKETILPFLNAL